MPALGMSYISLVKCFFVLKNMSEQKKEFTGVWIPREVIENDTLNAYEKILYVEIASFPVCFMLNKTLAIRIGASEKTVSRIIKKLTDSGYLKILKNDGRKRFVKAVRDFPIKEITVKESVGSTQGGQIVYADRTICLDSMDDLSTIDNSIDNNEDSKVSNETSIFIDSASDRVGDSIEFVPTNEEGDEIPQKKTNQWVQEREVEKLFMDECEKHKLPRPHQVPAYSLKTLKTALKVLDESDMQRYFDYWFESESKNPIDIQSAFASYMVSKFRTRNVTEKPKSNSKYDNIKVTKIKT